MRKLVMVMLVCFMLLSLGVAQAAPVRNSSHAVRASHNLYIQGAEIPNSGFGMVVSGINGDNAEIRVLYPNIVIELPVIIRSDGSLAVMAAMFNGWMHWQVAIPIMKNKQGEDIIPMVPYMNAMFETSDDGHLYVPMQDPEIWLPWRPIYTGTLF